MAKNEESKASPQVARLRALRQRVHESRVFGADEAQELLTVLIGDDAEVTKPTEPPPNTDGKPAA